MTEEKISKGLRLLCVILDPLFVQLHTEARLLQRHTPQKNLCFKHQTLATCWLERCLEKFVVEEGRCSQAGLRWKNIFMPKISILKIISIHTEAALPYGKGRQLPGASSIKGSPKFVPFFKFIKHFFLSCDTE